MIRTSLFVIIATFVISVLIFQHPQQRRVALVLSATWFDYQNSKKNFDTPTPDVSLTLSKLGFKVFESIEPTRETLQARVSEFVESLKEADVGLIYYSGKIGQFSGRSYLIPTDMKQVNARTLERNGIPLDPLIHEMSKRVNHSFVFLNACRDAGKPVKKQLGALEKCRGLQPVGAGANVLVAHASQPDRADSPHSEIEAVFVEALTNNLVKEDRPINLVLSDIRKDVIVATRARQKIWTENEKGKDFVFKTKPAPKGEKKQPKVASVLPLILTTPVEEKTTAIAKPTSLNLRPDQPGVKDKTGLGPEVRLPTPEEFLEEQRRLKDKDKLEVRMDQKTAIRVLQQKLYAFSCYRGRVDGIWGRGSKRAARAFHQNAKTNRKTVQPTVELYKTVSEFSGPVCGRPCKGKAKRGRNRKCVTVERKDLPFIPVIVDVAKPNKKIVKRRTIKRKKASIRKASLRKRYAKKRYKKTRYKRKKIKKRRYAKRYNRRLKRKKRRRATQRRRQRVSYYKPRRKKRSPWANFTD